MAVNDFDFVSPFYDPLSKLIFGQSLLEAQFNNLTEIRENDAVLILGGGTGEILEQIPRFGTIDFVEKSGRMLKKSKRSQYAGSVKFIHADVLEYDFKKKYDVIICPFFLDCFNDKHLNIAITKIRSLLKTDGMLMVCDFDKARIEPLLLRIMLAFFKLVSNLETNELLDIRAILKQNGFQESDITFLNKGIFSALYSQAK